jgi:hypothetical protein
MEIALYHNLGRLPEPEISPQILLRRQNSVLMHLLLPPAYNVSGSRQEHAQALDLRSILKGSDGLLFYHGSH